MCYPVFQALLQSNLATSVMHAEPARLSTAPSWWWLVSFIPCFLRLMQPFPFPFLGLCALHAMIALFYLSLFSLYHAKSYCCLLFRPMSTSPFLLILGFLPSYHLRGFMWRLFTRPLCFSSSCLSLGEKTLQVACQALVARWARWEGDVAEVELTNVAAFATCIAWTLYTLCYSSSHPNWFFALTPRTHSL